MVRRRWRRQEVRALLHEREEELARVRRSIEAAQANAPEPVPPWRQSPAPQPDVPEPDGAADASASHPPPGLSVYEQQAAALGLGGPCWWEDSPERRARHEARERDRYRAV